MSDTPPVTIAELRRRYLDGDADPVQETRAAYERFRSSGDPAIVVSEVPEERALSVAEALRGTDPAELPLYGIPFAVKDNIDVAGAATTAGCPQYAYRPSRDATVVARLVAAGAIPVVKTNLDQFATGLVGTRSPYGIPRLPWAPDRVPGGSSSGSGVAVARGLVPFALGTDTAGSGRVPAAFGGTVGVKPTRGRVSTAGVVPAVQSLDCVSIFARTVADGGAVLAVADGFDERDPLSRLAAAPVRNRPLRIGISSDVPSWVATALASSAEVVAVDLEPFVAIGMQLYGGPWVAARYAAVGAFVEAHPEATDPTVREIILDARRWCAADLAAAQLRLAGLAREVAHVWDSVDAIVTPTTPRHPTIDEVMADPIGVNSELGRYTNFVNLLDLSAVAVPPNLTVLAPAWCDHVAADVAALLAGREGTTDRIVLAVVGAHLAGEPLHHQLTDLGARFLRAARTAQTYRLHALAGTVPPKPGLERVTDGGAAIEIELYELDPASFGRFVAAIPPPLGIGPVTIDSGATVRGFLCEPAGLVGAADITHLGGWRQYDARRP